MLDRQNTGLIVVDIQGKLAHLVHDSDKMLANASKLIQGCQALGMPIIYLEQNPEKLGPTNPLISDLLRPQKAIPKYTFSACKAPEFMDAVQAAQVKTWLVCGIEAHICVYQTASDLLDLNYNLELVTDCITSRKLADKDLAIAKLASHGARLTSLEMCLYELVEDCRAPEFKTILKLIK